MAKNEQDDSWLLVFLRRVRHRPGMYLGDERLNSLSCYVQGAISALKHAGSAGDDEEAFLRAFGDWLGLKVDSKNGDCWYYLSLLPRAKQGVALFFEELNEFLIELGYEAGLDDEDLEVSRWGLSSSNES